MLQFSVAIKIKQTVMSQFAQLRQQNSMQYHYYAGIMFNSIVLEIMPAYNVSTPICDVYFASLTPLSNLVKMSF